VPAVSGRWSIRVDPGKDRVVRVAAASLGQSLRGFVVDAAVREAERVLDGRTAFVLDGRQWARFVELLDRPPRHNRGLEKLFATPSVFDPT
jgi:uncharacterized protein (DUF1778 family)